MKFLRTKVPQFVTYSTVVLLTLQQHHLHAQDAVSHTGMAAEPAPTFEGGSVVEPADRTQNLPFRVSVNVRQGYDDNVFTTRTNRISSPYTTAGLNILYSMGTPRTSLSTTLNLSGSYYWDRPGESFDWNPSLGIALNHSVSPRFNLSFSSNISYRSEPDFGETLGTTRRSGNYFYTSNSLSGSYQWTPRFSTVTSYSFSGVLYDDSAIGDVDNQNQQTLSQSFRYLVLPTTTAVIDYRLQFNTFQTNDISSHSHFILGGIDHTFNPRLNFSARGGMEFREFDISSEVNSPYVTSNLSYSYGPFSSLNWWTRYGLQAPNVSGLRTETTFNTGLRWTHGFSPVFSVYMSGFFRHSNKEGFGDIQGWRENAFDLEAGVRYSLNQHIILDAGYHFTTVTSDVQEREYDRNRYHIGMSYNF